MATGDYKRKLVDYCKRNLSKGYTPETLRWALIGQGYIKTSVENALDQAQKELAEKAPILKDKPVIKYEVLDEHDNPVIIKKSFWKKVSDWLFE